MLSKFKEFLVNRSLVFKLSASVLLSVIIGSLLLSIFVSNYSKPILKEQVISSAYKALGDLNSSIAQGAAIAEQSVVNTANILSLSEDASEKEVLKLASAALKSIEQQYGYFYEFWIYIPSKDPNVKGKMHHAYLKDGKVDAVVWSPEEQIKDREWLKFAKKHKKVHWSEPYMSIIPDGSLALSTTVSIPFRFKGEKQMSGVIGASGNLDNLRKNIASIKFESDGKALLMSDRGLFLVHPDKNVEMKKTIYELAKEFKMPQLNDLGRALQAGKSGFAVMPHSDVYNNDVVFVYMPVAKTHWSSCLVFSQDNFYRPVKNFHRIIVLVTLIGLLGLLFVINWICTFTTSPLVRLASVADKYGKGEFSASLPPVTSNDEVGILTQAFYNMRDNLLNLIDIQKKNAANEQKRLSELEIAAQIQHSALPSIFPKEEKFVMSASMVAAREVGGDFYDFFFIDDKHFAFLIADVSGKGVPAALFMMSAKALLKNNIKKGCALNVAIENTNNALCTDNKAQMFVTAFVAVLDVETGELTYVNAGHNPPLIKKDGKYEYLKGETNLVLAAMGNISYSQANLTLNKNDSIFIYTDGIVEAQNAKNEFYGDDRLAQKLNEQNLNPDETLKFIKNDIDEFSHGIEQYDDITMLNLTYLGWNSYQNRV